MLSKYIGWLSDIKTGDGSTVEFSEDFPYLVFETELLGSRLVDYGYGQTLAEMGVKLSYASITDKREYDLNAEQVLALIIAVFRNDTFSEGIIMSYLSFGAMRKWLKRLKDIDTEKSFR